MKIQPIALMLLALPLAAAAQLPGAPPPVEMGLWKTTNTTTMTGMALPPDMAARLKAMGRDPSQPTTIHTLACVTPEKWRELFNRMSKNQNCTYSNVHESSAGMSADISCAGLNNATGHMEMIFDSRAKMHGSFHMEMSRPQQSEPVKADSKFEGEYQGADCKGISPNSPQIQP